MAVTLDETVRGPRRSPRLFALGVVCLVVAVAAAAVGLAGGLDDPPARQQQRPADATTPTPEGSVSASSPAVELADENIKETGTSGELATLGTARDPAYSHAIRVAVLLEVGQDDTLFCAATRALSCASSQAVWNREAAYYPGTHLTVDVLPRAGHDTNLHPDAIQWFDQARQWTTDLLDDTFDTTGGLASGEGSGR
jgi:hypothetical protein